MKKIVENLMCLFVWHRAGRRKICQLLIPDIECKYRIPANPKKKNALITTWYIDGFHGGAIYTAEIAKALSSMGYNVYICGVEIDNNRLMKRYSECGANVYKPSRLPTDIEYDLVWAHHFPIIANLIMRGLKFKRLIFSSISSLLPIEAPVAFWKHANAFLVLSKRHRDNFHAKYGIPKNKMMIFPNGCGPEYFTRHKNLSALRKIAIVSNHVPPELLRARKSLQKQGFTVDIYGMGYKYVMITPEILLKYDAIITIGKTAQSALALGIPLYNYDRFGGPGWITTKNIDAEQAHNFAGRKGGMLCKTAEKIAAEIIRGWETARKEQNVLIEIAKERFNISERITRLVCKSKKPATAVKITTENALWFNACEFIFQLQRL